MSGVFDFSATNCLVWTVEKPFYDIDRKSPTFSYLDNKWYFSLCFDTIRDYNRYSLTVNSVDEQKILDTEAKLTVHIYGYYNESMMHLEIPNLRHGSYGAARIKTSKDDMYGRLGVCVIFPTDIASELHVEESEAKHLTSSLTAQSKLSDSSRIIKKAKLAANPIDNSLSDEEILSTDFGKLLEQQTSSDVTLTCGDRTFAAHRLVLAARSEVFAAMFQNKMIESVTGRIDIKDIDDEVFELLLKYVYTGKISDLSVDIASKLYIAADKYSIQSLKNKCSKWMLGSLTEQNCLDFLIISNTLNDEMLNDRLINFVAEILQLLEGDEWQKFSAEHPKLALSVYERRVFNKSV